MKKIKERGETMFLGDDGPLSCCGVSDPYQSTATAPIKRGRPRAPGVEDIRYTNPITGVTSSTSQYINEQGIKKKMPTHKMEYKINGEWVKNGEAPHQRKNQRNFCNSKKGYFCKKLNEINSREKKWKKQGRFLLGDHEFKDDRWGRCDKLMEAFDEQVERYGDICPITLIPFTMETPLKKFDINNQIKTFSNISPDRIFNHTRYTKQNTIFTSQLWNLKKDESPMEHLELALNPEWMKRYKAIIMERFPDQIYVLQT